jgi:hypothetical protein
MSACGIDRAAKVISALRHAVVGVAEQRLRNADMLRVVDRQFGWNNLAKEMWVQMAAAAELAFGSASDE